MTSMSEVREELDEQLRAVLRAKWSDSNDGEIEALQEALDTALDMLEIPMPERCEQWLMPHTPPFDEAEFYELGTVVMVWGPHGRYSVDSEGTRDYEHPDLDECIRNPEQFRTAFPDGNLPEDGVDGWSIQNNGWFQVYDGDGDEIDDPGYSLDEALDFAREQAGTA